MSILVINICQGEEQQKILDIANSLKEFGNAMLEIKKNFIVSCWHINSNYSEAMWKVYCPNNDGIAIETTLGRLKKSFSKIDEDIRYGKVTYNFSSEIRDDFDSFIKRPYFKYENEMRLVISDSNFKDYPHGRLVGNIDLNCLINNIHIAPEAPLWIKDLIKEILENNNIEIGGQVIHTNLYKIFKNQEG